MVYLPNGSSELFLILGCMTSNVLYLSVSTLYSIYFFNGRGDEWSLRAFASMPSTAIFLGARAEIKNLLCELASNAKIWGARASEHSFKFCEQLKILMDHSSPLMEN